MKCCVYILVSLKHNRNYIGSSVNRLKRETEHNQGKTISTKNKGPWKIVFQQEFESVHIARKIENKLKRMKSRIIIEQIIRDNRIRMNIHGD